MQRRFPGDGSYDHVLKLRQHLAAFGLGGEALPNQRIATLSGGQKCRLAFAEVLYARPHLLIMDEPTNHLDLETVDALIRAIEQFRGGLVLVSHDEYLLTHVVQELWVVGDGRCEKLGGDFRAYKTRVLRESR